MAKNKHKSYLNRYLNSYGKASILFEQGWHTLDSRLNKLMLKFWGKIRFIALKRSIKDERALCYKTAEVTLLLDLSLLTVLNCLDNIMFIVLKKLWNMGGGGGGIVI